MNLFVPVTLALLALLIIGYCRYKRKEFILLVMYRLVGTIIMFCPLMYLMVRETERFSDWAIVFVIGGGYLAFNIACSLLFEAFRLNVNHCAVTAAVEKAAEKRAFEIVERRDADEFWKIHRKELDRRIAESFDQQLEQALKGDAHRKIEAELRARFEGGNLENAIWIGLHGAAKVLGGCDHNESHQMLAVPFWVEYSFDKPPVSRRFNQTHAVLKPLSEISFIAKRWSKVDGETALVLNGALVYPPKS